MTDLVAANLPQEVFAETGGMDEKNENKDSSGLYPSSASIQHSNRTNKSNIVGAINTFVQNSESRNMAQQKLKLMKLQEERLQQEKERSTTVSRREEEDH